MGTKSKAKKSKKGPKGRKARAKAKLEQVWGESVDEEARRASRFRPGRSRLLDGDDRGASRSLSDADGSRRRKGEATEFLARSDGLRRNTVGNGGGGGVSSPARRRLSLWGGCRGELPSSDDGDDSSSGGESEGIRNGVANGGAFATLLRRIDSSRKPPRGMTFARPDGDSDSGGDVIESDSTVGDAKTGFSHDCEGSGVSSSEGDEENTPDECVAGDRTEGIGAGAASAEDPYDAHFSRPALPRRDSLNSASVMRHNGNKPKVVAMSLLDASMEVQMTGPLLDAWERVATSSSGGGTADGRRAWEKFAAGPYGHARQVLVRNWDAMNGSSTRCSRAGKGRIDGDGGDSGGRAPFTSMQLAAYPAVSRYADVLISSETRQRRDEIYNMLSMHVLNHVLTSRTRVQRHNRRIKELSNLDKASRERLNSKEGEDKWRDQGYTRPKVLVLLPTRGECWSFVKRMKLLLGNAVTLENEARFDEEYGPVDPEGGDEGEDAGDAEARRKAVMRQKGAEWNDLFGDGVNSDDDFRIGMTLTPNVVRSTGKSMGGRTVNGQTAAAGASGVNTKLFTEFYRSDVILASPIGLKMATTGNVNDKCDEEEVDAETDVDFLSSIDICLVARGDVLLMQNWDHVEGILGLLNRQLRKMGDTDFSRVRNYFLEGQGSHWRQLIVVSKFTDPYILSTFRKHAKNVEGQMRIRRKVPSDDASICDVVVRTRQVFQRVTCGAVTEAGADRLRYFSEKVLPKLMRLKQKHTLIYIPSYFDFMAVRNLLLKREADFVSVTEYSRVSEVSRGRARFIQGRKAIMLYTGRAHFFFRHKIRGVRHVIFYGLPEHAEFFPAVVNMLKAGLSNSNMEENEEEIISHMPMSCLSLFTKFDAHQLERVVGTTHAERMVRGEKNSYMFCS